jgi:hypothetical protein
VTAFRTPWEDDPAPAEAPPPGPTLAPRAKARGRRPAASRPQPAPAHPAWLCHHLTITGPVGAVEAFAAAARGSGVIPWQLDGGALEEDVFNLAAAQPQAQRRLSIEGCRILARQVRDRVEARQARAAALVGRSRACPFDLHALLPVPDAVLQLGPTHPQAAAWLQENWGTADKPRHVAGRPDARPGRRLPRDHAVLGYGFFTAGNTPYAAVTQLAARWPTLRFVLRPRPD